VQNTSSRVDLQLNSSNSIQSHQPSNNLLFFLNSDSQKSPINGQTPDLETNICLSSYTSQPSPLDDFNIPTPTQLEPSTNHFNTTKPSSQILQTKNEFTNNNPVTYNQFYNNMVPSYQQSHNNQDQYNPLISNGIQVGGSANLNNTQISMMIPTPTGFFSRSNSQPDLTLNLEKPVPNSNTYNINNNYCYYFNSNNTDSSTNSNSNQIFNR